MIQGPLAVHEVETGHTMVDVDIFDVLFDQGTFDVEGLQVRGGHDHHVGIHPHHELDQGQGTYIVGLDPGIGLLEDPVMVVAGHIVDDQV